MAKNNHIMCLVGNCFDIQPDVATKVDEGYKILDIHSQFVTDSGYADPKSIVWLQKEVEVTHE